MRMRHIVNCGMSHSIIFFHITTYTARLSRKKKKLLNTKCLFWYSIQFVFETFFILRKTERDRSKMYIGFHVKNPFSLPDFNETFLDNFSKNTKISNFVKIHPVEDELYHADIENGRADPTKLIVASRNFAKAPKSECCIFVAITSKATYISTPLTETFKNKQHVFSSSVVCFQRTTVTVTSDVSVDDTVIYLPNKRKHGRNSFKGFKVYLLLSYSLFRSRNIFKTLIFYGFGNSFAHSWRQRIPFELIYEDWIELYCIVVGSRRLMPPDALQPKAYRTNLVFSRSYLHRQVSPPETLVAKGGTNWARNGRWILPENARLPRNIQGSFTCRKSTTWDNGFTSLPKEGVLRIFSPWKIRRLRPGLNPRTWVPKASTLLLDHRSR